MYGGNFKLQNYPTTKLPNLFFDPALVRAGDAHVFAVFGNCPPGHLDALRLQDPCDLLVGQGAAGIFFLDELFDAALQDQQRRSAAFRSLHALAEEVAQLENALRRVSILAGHRPAYRGRMHADFFGHLLDHHRLQVIDTSFQKILLAGNYRVAVLGDGPLPLLNILDELDGALVALFDVIARVLVVDTVASDQLLVGRIEPKLGHILVVHDDQPLVAVLHECDVRLDQPWLDYVVAKSGAGIERADVFQRLLTGFDRAPNSFADFLVLLVLQAAQVLVHYRDCVLQNLGSAVSVLLQC